MCAGIGNIEWFNHLPELEEDSWEGSFIWVVCWSCGCVSEMGTCYIRSYTHEDDYPDWDMHYVASDGQKIALSFEGHKPKHDYVSAFAKYNGPNWIHDRTYRQRPIDICVSKTKDTVQPL